MGILFISHSSRDNAASIKVRDWLKANGWGEVFLDLDPEQGLAAGHRWQQELKQAGERCSGVVVLLSPDWIASRWCQTEFLIADQLGKKIFPLLVAPTRFEDLPIELKAKYQAVDISTPDKEADGFARLAIGLKRSGLDPRSFPWPPSNDPHRPIYRGLESLDQEDAAIFFGRDALITKGLDTLRRMRDGAAERVFVILGASGAGKSSFLKAGLLARLMRDEENFLVLPVIRPERAALTGAQGLAASVGLEASQLNDAKDLARVFAATRAKVVERLRRFTDNSPEARIAAPPTIIVALDQGEELFAAENPEAQKVLDILTGAIRADKNSLVIAAIRSDAFAKVQSRPKLSEIPLLPFSLPTIPLGAFKEVIEGPARLADPPLTIEPSLSDRLLQDLAADDALPLLAFTLERLASRHRGGGTLTLAEYTEKLGGLQGAIVGAVEAAFSEARRDPLMPQSHTELEALTRTAFIPCLVNLDDADAQPRRRVEKLSSFSEAAQPLIQHFINQRLLVSNRSVIDGVETATVEVTHEAILRQWPALRAWIAEERDALRTLESVRAAAQEWDTARKHEGTRLGESWLVHRGGRLHEAEALLVRPGFAAGIGAIEREYIVSCRNYENSELLREQKAVARTRRLQRIIGTVIAAAAVVVLVAGLGIVQLVSGLAEGARDSLLTQAAHDADLENYERSARYALAGLAAAGWAHKSNDGEISSAEAELRGSVSESNAVAVLRGHANQVLWAAFNPDGTLVVTGSRDKTARIWSVHTGDTVRILRGHSGAVTGADFSPDGTRIATASEDKSARIWNAQTGQAILTLRGHKDAVYSVVFSANGKRIATASGDNTVRVWDAETGAKLAEMVGHEATVYEAAFSPDGRFVVTASEDKTARIWDSQTGRQINVLKGHEARVNGAVFSPDGKLIATASDDGTARIWDAQTALPLKELQHEAPVNAVSFSSDGKRLATGSKDDMSRIWNVNTGHLEVTVRGHIDAINSVAFSPNGVYFATTSDDRTARLWEARARVIVLRGHNDGLNRAVFSGDGRRVATASADRTARLWDSLTGDEFRVFEGHAGIVESLAFSPDGSRLVTGSDDRSARIWDTATGRQLRVLSGCTEKVYAVAYSSDGESVAAACTDGVVRIWNSRTGQTLTVIAASRRSLNSVEFSPDGSRIVSGSDDGTAKVWLRANALDPLVLQHGGTVYDAAFSPDGSKVVTAGSDRTAVIWDARTGQKLKVLAGHSAIVLTAAFSPDGKQIVTASQDQTARIWDASSGAEIAILRGHGGSVQSAVFSPDGTRVVTGSSDSTARVWNVANVDSESGSKLVHRICETSLGRGLSQFSGTEIGAVPALNPMLDSDACHPPTLWARLGQIFLAGISR